LYELILILWLQKEQMAEVNNERKMLTQLKHKSIVPMKSAWVDKTHMYIVLDYALNGDLSSFLSKKRK